MFPLYSDRPLSAYPFVTLMLISTNIAVFIYQLTGSGSFDHSVMRFGMIPYNLFNDYQGGVIPAQATILTSMFLHGGIFHLLSNMLYLWVFGRDVEDDLGHLRYLLFYLAAGIISATAFAFAFPSGKIPLVGASGAIAGVLGIYFLRYPLSRIYTVFLFIIFIRIIPIPAFIFLGFWFVIQMINSMGSAMDTAPGGIAWIAHVAGFTTGLVFIIWDLRRRFHAHRR
jgi:membrane associated rhomboid family serine protease